MRQHRFCVVVTIAVLALAFGASPGATASPCGYDGQRACCLGEASFGACADGVTEVNGCSGDCQCSGSIFSSNSHCVQAPPCGGIDQRACCGGELIDGVRSCDEDLVEVTGCSGDCFCGGDANPTGVSSSGTCREVSPCGGDGQRACCIGEASFGACRDGLTEVNGCEGNCVCSGGAASSNSHCRQATPCGGEGQRACCGGELIDALSCGPGLVEVTGCTGDCFCGGAANPFAIDSNGICVTPTPCGQSGQRACCVLEGNPCAPGVTPIPGCTGDCFCKGGVAAHTCVQLDASGKLPRIDQPGTGSSATTAPRACGLRGYADLHLHMFSDTAHGGGVLSGEPYDPVNDDPNVALRPDYGTHRDLVTKSGGELPAANCPSYIVDCGAKLFHGDHFPLIDDPLGTGTGDGSGSFLGAPAFNGWPTWHTTTHQQVYYKWLERAYRGGLRLVTMLAVTNEALCLSNKRLRGTDCADSMAAVDEQLAAARAFETFLDERSGGPGTGWFRIVETPSEARQVIADGKLAVVLGIEVDNLFNCHWDDREDTTGACSPDGIRAKVQEYYDKGVRHVFPIHNFNNAFGGPATWQDAIDVGNRASEGHWWSFGMDENGEPTSDYRIVDCGPQGYGFKLSCVMQSLVQLLGFPESVIPLGDPIPCYDVTATCNPIALTSRGQVLVEALMDAGMIIDVDHMSIRALNETIAMATAKDYPLVASHVQFFDLNEPGRRHERMRTRAELETIRDLGGMVAAMLKDDSQDSLGGTDSKPNVPYTTSPSGITIPDECRHSSQTYAQALQYAVDVMGGPVAFGSDFNGVAGHVGPRFGSDACGGNAAERSKQYRANNRVPYPFELPEPGFDTMDKQAVGLKTFDYNVDGLAHVGLLPDLVADLAKVGLPQSYLDALFGSAEAYIRVWEKASGTPNPVATPTCEPVTVDAGATCTAAASIAPQSLRDDPSLTLIQTPPGPYARGTTPVELAVSSDLSCTPGRCTADVTVVDRTPPPIDCAATTIAECQGATTPVTFPAATLGADNCGVALSDGCTPSSGSRFVLGDTPVTCAAHDDAGNTGSCQTTVRVQDTTPPTVTCPSAQTLECTGGQRATATYAAPASDMCSGTLAAGCAPASGSSFALGTTAINCSATDGSGNGSSCPTSVTVRDTTAPELGCPAPQVLECTGGGHAEATVEATATDLCWGSLAASCVPGSGAFPLGTTAVICSTTDGSGNQSTCPSTVTVQDTTPPVVTCAVTTGVLTTPWPPNHELLDVGFSVAAHDACTGQLPVAVRVYADEDDETPTDRKTVHSPDAANVAPGTLRLRQERLDSEGGRVYLILSQAADGSGNTGTACCTVAVPHDLKTSSLEAAVAEAAAARHACVAGGGAVPAGYVPVGDGPLIGPKQ